MTARRFFTFILFSSFVSRGIFANTLGAEPDFKLPTKPRFSLMGTGERDPQVGEYSAGYFPGAIMIPVHLWGATKTTGLFKVPRNTTLSTFLSYAKGPADNAVLDEVKIKRVSDKQEKIYTVDMEKVFENPTSNDPVLMPNDIVYVRPKKPFISSDVAQVIAILGGVASIILAGLIIDEKSR